METDNATLSLHDALPICSKLICKCLKYFCSNQKFNLKTITIKLDYYKKLLGCRSLQRSVQN